MEIKKVLKMLWKRKKTKIHIQIEFDKETEEMKIVGLPSSTRPTELIQVLMFAINVINQTLQEELEKKKPEEKKKLTYIG